MASEAVLCMMLQTSIRSFPAGKCTYNTCMSWYELWSVTIVQTDVYMSLIDCVLQGFSNIMGGLATLRFFVPPQLAETIVAALHRGVMQGSDDPWAIRRVLWACATLGYLPSTRMLEDFKVTLLCITFMYCMYNLTPFQRPGRLRCTQGCP